MDDTQTMLEFNHGPDADFLTGVSLPPDVVGDWFFSVAEDRTTHFPLRTANTHVQGRINL